MDDHNTGLLPAVTPNSGTGSAQNSQCTLNGAGTSKSESGTDVTLTVSLTFRPNFAGMTVAYAGVQTVSNANTGWRALGWWTIPSN